MAHVLRIIKTLGDESREGPGVKGHSHLGSKFEAQPGL